MIQQDSIPATLVNTIKARHLDFQYIIESSGKIRSEREQLVTSELEGKVVLCNATEGKIVGAGELIAKLESENIQFRIKRAELNRFNNEKEYESQLLGYENLLKNISASEVQNIKKKLKIAAGLSLSELDIKEAEHDLTKTLIIAPYNGVLSDINIAAGQLVKAGRELFRIYDPGSLILEIRILEGDIFLFKKGLVADVIPVAAPNRVFKATVTSINPYINEDGMVLVKLKPKESKEIFPGMNCKVVVKVTAGHSLVVPRESIIMRGGKPVIFTIEGRKAKWNYVKPGRSNGTEMEILEGIKQGDRVIISNNLQLSHDSPIRESGKEDIN